MLSGYGKQGSIRQMLKEVDIPRLAEEPPYLSRVHRDLEMMKPACSWVWSSTGSYVEDNASDSGGFDDHEENIASEGYRDKTMVRQRLSEIEKALRKLTKDLEERIVGKYKVPVGVKRGNV